MLTTEQTEKLYIEHAADFRLLLGCSENNEETIAYFDGYNLAAPRLCDQHSDNIHLSSWSMRGYRIPTPLAVAAMTECWRERLEKQYGLHFHCCKSGWATTREDGLYLIGGEWRKDKAGAILPYMALPEMICAVVKALVAEKSSVAKKVAESAILMAKRCQSTVGGSPIGDLATLIASLANRVAELE